MKNIARQGARALAACLTLAVLCVCVSPAAARRATPHRAPTPRSIIRSWPPRERAVARELIEKYGEPQQFDRHALAWFDNGNWKRTIVYRRPPRLAKGTPARGFLQQTIGYIVPEDKLAELRRFSDRLQANSTAGELTFTSYSEATNLLGLNLADEIVIGRRSVAQARAFFSRASRLAASGKSSPYLARLRFEVDNDRYMAPTGGDR